MIEIRRKGLLFIGLPLMLLFFLGNHAEYLLRCRQMDRQGKEHAQIVVRAESSALGHNTIGIDESRITGNSGQQMLFFSTLGNWEYEAHHAVACPTAIQALNGHQVSCVGFMYPLQTGDSIKTFCLLRSTQTCCYGPRPQFNQYLLVESRTPVKFERFAPIIVRGAFFVDPQPDQGFIYRLEASAVEHAADEPPEINAAAAAQKAKLPLFSFTPLAAMAAHRESPTLPAELLAQEGKLVVLDGFCVGRTKDSLPRVIIGKEWWDGVSQGTPPTLYNAVMVTPRDAQQTPPLWQTHIVMSGKLHITRDPEEQATQGIVSLRDASIGVPGSGAGSLLFIDGGPFLSTNEETILLLALLVFTLRWKRTAAAEATKDEKGAKNA